MTATTFDLVKKANTNLTGSNLVATSTGAGGVASSRLATGPFYAEFTITTLTGVPRVGFSTSNAPQTTTLENGLYCLGYDPTGAVKVNNVTLATIATYAQGNRIDMAVDVLNHLVWFRVNGGNWNNNVANDPATGVGGIDYSTAITIMSGVQAAVSASLTGNVWTAVFSSAGWAGAAPAGFSSLDAVQITLVTNVNKMEEIVGIAPDFSMAVRCHLEPRRYQRNYNGSTVTTVSGYIRELSVPVAGRRVDVYDRLTGELLGTTVSAGDGSWSVPCLGRPTVRVVASDPTTYNSLALDNVSPA